MDKNVEFNFLQDQIANDGDKQISRVLWTAYCYHHNMNVDTYEYDTVIYNLFQWCQKYSYIRDAGSTYEKFYNFMSEFLV